MSCTVLIFIIYVNKRLNLFVHFILPTGDLKKAVMMRFLIMYIYIFIYRYMKMHTPMYVSIYLRMLIFFYVDLIGVLDDYSALIIDKILL